VLDGFTGAISGVPTTWGTTTAVIRVTDSSDANRSDSKTLTLTIAPSPVVITTTSLPTAGVGRAYSATLQAVGGTGLTAWSMVSGSLPSGLSLGSDGVITGTPVSVDSESITVQAVDTGWAGNMATQTLTLTVAASEIVLYASDASRISGTWTL